MAREISDDPPHREMDMLLSAGERISAALVAMAIHDLGHNAISLTGSQAGIVTDQAHTKAKILDIRPHRVQKALDEGKVVLVAGFQGISTITNDITTLGRGGSDTTAVALAAALGAEVCEIYTDVDGVYTTDPRIVPEARKLPRISYEEMLEMAATGAKVLMLRSVEFARRYGVALHVRSSFTDAPGTWIVQEEENMEQAIVSGVTYALEEAKVTLHRVCDKPGVAARVFTALAGANINVDMIIQNVSEGGTTDISFTVADDDVLTVTSLLCGLQEELGFERLETDDNMAKVSLVGAGMKTHPGVAAKMFEVLAENDINIEMISTSSIKISCVIEKQHTEQAVKALHQAFGLEAEQIEHEETLGR
ncbi:MAG: aspartate kinase [Thermoleophilia bacterium]|nr:aspartate kinase [Thermoleophilia bacterium]